MQGAARGQSGRGWSRRWREDRAEEGGAGPGALSDRGLAGSEGGERCRGAREDRAAEAGAGVVEKAERQKLEHGEEPGAAQKAARRQSSRGRSCFRSRGAMWEAARGQSSRGRRRGSERAEQQRPELDREPAAEQGQEPGAELGAAK